MVYVTTVNNSVYAFDANDCKNYSKMAPPTIANGKVYLASFGTENIGTGQLCVYGLLPKSEGFCGLLLF